MAFKMKNPTTEILTGLSGNSMMEAAKATPLEKKGKKEERKSLKAGGATKKEVKAFNKYQRTRKGEIASAARAADNA